MGLKDHVEDGAGHILDLGLDLEYLHVEGADRQAGGAAGPPAMEEEGESSSSSTASSPSPGEVEESAGSDVEPESGSSGNASLNSDGGESGSVQSKNGHQLLCRAQCVDLGTEGPPEPLSEPLPKPPSQPTPEPPSQPSPEPPSQPSPEPPSQPSPEPPSQPSPEPPSQPSPEPPSQPTPEPPSQPSPEPPSQPTPEPPSQPSPEPPSQPSPEPPSQPSPEPPSQPSPEPPSQPSPEPPSQPSPEPPSQPSPEPPSHPSPEPPSQPSPEPPSQPSPEPKLSAPSDPPPSSLSKCPSEPTPTTPPPSDPASEPTPTTPPPSDPVSECGSGDAAGPGFSVKEYQAKLDFALKLGYSEETVRLVLSKLGPDTLINDILGELVKLGTKSDSEQATGSIASTSSSSSSSSSCSCLDSLEGQRSDSPCPADSLCDQDNLRPVVVDGSNVAMSHGNKEVFSCHGIQLAVDWFLERGHHDITVFVPAWRKEQSRPDAPITDQEILRRLEKEKILVFTPSRRVQGRRVVCYDDRFIVKLAYESDGIIVSNDNYRDLANERPEWKKLIDERLLMYSFVNDKFMPPDDPLGRHGPSLDNFLRKRPIMPEQKKQPCPYGKKCTYGHKCKYYHPERGAQPQRAVADELRAIAKTCVPAKNQGDTGLVKSHSVPAGAVEAMKGAPKRQSDPSIRALSYSDAEEKLLAKGRGEGLKNTMCSSSNSSSSSSSSNSSSSSSSSGSSSGSNIMSPAPGGPPSGLSLPQEQPSRAGTPHGHPNPDLYTHHEPLDMSYYSVMKAYSGLSLTPRRSPDCRFPNDTDLRLGSAGSAGSDCGSESSVSCGSSCESYSERACPGCPPEPVLEDGLHYINPHSCLYRHHLTANHESHSLHPADYTNILHSHAPNSGLHSYHMSLARGQTYAHEPPPDAQPKRPLYPLPPHLQHQPLGARSSCPGDYPSLPQTNPHPPGSPLDRRLAPTRAESVSDSHLYEHLSASHLRPKAFSSWDSYYRQPPSQPSRYEPSSYQSLPDTRQSAWHAGPWARDDYARQQHHHSSHPALHPSPTHYLNHPPPSHSPHPPHPSGASLSPYPSSPHLTVSSHAPPYMPHHSEPPAHGQYQDAREKVYMNLCNIFPSELVSRVMGRSPHITDPQQLAAAILAEKAHTGY